MAGALGLDEQALLRKWDYSYLSRTEDPPRYIAMFPCHKCGATAYEIFLEVSAPSERLARKLNLDDYDLWMVRWGSACGHVSGRLDVAACVAIDIQEKGQFAGIIEPVFPPPWFRYEREGARGACVQFGTLWQAQHASKADFDALAALRKDKPETFRVNRESDGGQVMLPAEERFTAKELGETIARFLNLRVGDEVGFLRDKLDRNRIMVVRHTPTAYVSMAHDAVASLKQDIEIEEEGTIAEGSMASSDRRHGHMGMT